VTEKSFRVYFRLACRFPVTVRRETAPCSFKASACDLSTNGLSFVTDQTFAAGEHLHLRFKLPGTFGAHEAWAVVRRQAPGKDIPEGSFMTGVQFTSRTADAVVRAISDFMTRKTSFASLRLWTMAAGLLLALITFSRCAGISLEHYYLGTTAGKGWFLPDFRWDGYWRVYVLAHVFLGITLIISSVGVYRLRSWARKVLAWACLLGLAGQAGRLYLKIGFLKLDAGFQLFYAGEIFCLLVFALLAFFLSRRKTAEPFDVYLKNLATHLKY